MTEKQENILKAALQLFATQGYAATSTSKVAKAAGVSEGLIFRHFGNKEGLLEAIMEMANQSLQQNIGLLLMTSDPKEILSKLFDMMFSMSENEKEMWRLMYALKWQMDKYNMSKYDALKAVFKDAFEKLGYEDPAAEAEIIFMLMDGSATAFLLHPPQNKSDILKALKKKYEL